MSGSEEKLAPVIYLFGAKAPTAEAAGKVLSAGVLPEAVMPEAVMPDAVMPEAVSAEVLLPGSEPLERTTDTPQRSGTFGRVNNVSSTSVSVNPVSVNPVSVNPVTVNPVSLNALARKGMSSLEMTQLLESRDLDPADIAEEIDRLEGVGLLDDLALAETLVRTLQDRKGLGRSAINAELRRRKIDAEAINEAMEAVDSDDELIRAIEIAQKRAPQLSSYDNETAKRRLTAYLMRRGYNGSIISAAIAASLGNSAAGNRTSSSRPRFR